jgi:hypothetical protein
MKNPVEHSTATHPGSAELDRLRAGLLDGDPARRAELEQHLRVCRMCREQVGLWSKVAETLDRGASESGVMSRVDARRHRALHGFSRPVRRLTPVALALAATLAAVAIGLGVYISHERTNPDVTAVANGEQGDLYADIDFYLWLMEQKANEDGSNS